MIGVGLAYALTGAMLAGVAVVNAMDRDQPKRWRKAGFWGLFAASFLFGDRLGDVGNGLLVAALVLTGALGGFGKGADRPIPRGTLGPRLFLPILVVPVAALVGSLAFKALVFHGHPLVDPKQTTVIALAIGAALALVLAMVMLRSTLAAPIVEARRLMDSVGWAAILPQLLAALGAVFALAGVGGAVGRLLGNGLPLDNRLAAVAAFGIGMALFTMIMGNAFAALPVMVAAIGAPLLIGHFGGDAAVIGSLGMLCGFCGTLMTPMAAHNIVPTALLDLPPGAVIRAQAPTAVLVLLVNLILIETLAFPR